MGLDRWFKHFVSVKKDFRISVSYIYEIIAIILIIKNIYSRPDMEDYHPRISFDVEKMGTNMLISPALYPKNFDFLSSNKKFECFESPHLHPAEPAKFYSYSGDHFIGSGYVKDEDFILDSTDGSKTELQSHTNSNIGHPHLEISFENGHEFKPQDPMMDTHFVPRSRGPSFTLGKGRRNSEDYFAGDLSSFFRNEDHSGKYLTQMKQEYHDSYLGKFSNFQLKKDSDVAHQLTASPNFLPKKAKPSTEAEYGYIMQPLNLDVHSYTSNQNTKQHNFENQEVINAPKKKRKGNKTEAITQSSTISPKPKKSKSEGKKSGFAVEPSTSLKLKITKLNDDKKVIVIRNKSKKSGVKKEEGNIKMEHDGKEKLTDLTQGNSRSTKIEDIGLSRTQNLSLPLKKTELWGNFPIPSEIEEYINNNSKMLNNLPFQAPSVRKIGTLTVEERRIKIEKYLLKRKKRTWSKKISYDCRKRVADSRLRIKGRFVTKDQAFAMLGPDAQGHDFDKISNTEIKNLLNQKFGLLIGKKKEKGDKDSLGTKVEDSTLDDININESHFSNDSL